MIHLLVQPGNSRLEICYAESNVFLHLFLFKSTIENDHFQGDFGRK